MWLTFRPHSGCGVATALLYLDKPVFRGCLTADRNTITPAKNRPCITSFMISSHLRLRHAAASALATLLLSSTMIAGAPGRRNVQPPKPAPPPPVLEVAAGTRLLVIAPHPDDEVLGAGGLMQRVKATGGTVRVVFLTHGDGYPEGVKEEDHVEAPTANDYLGYGKQRRREAHAALVRLGLADAFQTFLGFPDGGLCKLTRAYWSERRGAYRSPYTRLNRPGKPRIVGPGTEYRGEDLAQELAQIIGDFRPTLILVPRKEDQHADHCAAWFFLADAITAVRRVHADYSVDVLTYVVHFYGWPFDDEEQRLPPPP